ncbi:PREDICTED: mitogen-activated protein kinase kinase kinase YODA isoform X1 [Nelumbo nucifera]|uniref:mitogen-activated protein kinase kinase kinase n=2 Tax=Nelumbo nucifera TaxID=4432 RepID=A0A822ZFW1_NELNU|nr:PREDICTED: mitogen-activated protein kinase kinase kinase YODA isoform X1 [Nelumbo nucifera]DAD40518.1 TPA_asm: hypothetical protein HUJ06_014841 [Nelumbo nucifera]
MHWWQSSFSSPSSSSSPSPKSSSGYHKKRNNVRDINFFRSRRVTHAQPRLTRQRKLRHLSDLDIRRLSLDNYDDHNSLPVSKSSNNLEILSGRSSLSSSSSVVPQPLPRPDLSAVIRREPAFSSPHSTDFPLPSPKKVPSRGEGEDGDKRDSLAGDGTGRGILPTSAIGSRFSYQAVHKSPDHVDILSDKSPKDRMRIVLQDPNNVDKVRDNHIFNFPTKSAPTSGFSSPALSPRRLSNCDLFPPYIHSQVQQTWSAPELPPLDLLVGFSSQTSPEKTLSGFDHYSLHSPKVSSSGLNIKSRSGAAPPSHPTLSPELLSACIENGSPRINSYSQNVKSPNGPASPLHPKLSPECLAVWHESNGHVNVHPLPLPPPPSYFLHQTAAKVEVSSLAGQWQKGKLIGSGTFGSVYVATNRETGALCAMKEVNLIPDDPKSAECIKQLEQEIKVLSQLKHPNIVQYYGSEIIEERFYIYLEYVYPGSINKYVRDHCGAITESVVRNFTRHILSGLAYLHSTKTIHRDIKGANMLVDASGVVKLADFGMAKHLNGQSTDLSLKGSPYWMAPEVIQAMIKKDTSLDLAYSIDIWSLGCTVIEMLNGKPPWNELEGVGAMFQALKGSPPIPETLSPEGKDFLRCCFQRNPADRPSAIMLLEHPFVRISNYPEGPGFLQAFSGMKLVDKAYNTREWNKHKSEMVSTSPSTSTTKGSIPSNGDQQSHAETCDSAAASHHSPKSILEAFGSLSPHSNSTHNSRHSQQCRLAHLEQPLICLHKSLWEEVSQLY